MGIGAVEINYGPINKMLWDYRQTLERFGFLLEMQFLVLREARQDWQHHMANLLEEMAVTIGTLDLERELLLGQTSLADLVDEAPEPWSEILAEQYTALRSATTSLAELRERNEHVAAAGSAGITQLLDALVHRDTTDAYDETGKKANERSQRHNVAALFDGRA